MLERQSVARLISHHPAGIFNKGHEIEEKNRRIISTNQRLHFMLFSSRFKQRATAESGDPLGPRCLPAADAIPQHSFTYLSTPDWLPDRFS